MTMLAEWWSTEVPAKRRSRSLFRHSAHDAWLLAATLAQTLLSVAAFAGLARSGTLGLAAAGVAFGAGVCWCSNTVSHNHLHNPLFRARKLNRAFDLWLTLLLAVPQTLWKARHLWHHAGEPVRPRRALGRATWLELALVVGGWLAFLALSPKLFLLAYLPGWLFGMALCRLQGDMEHARRERPEAGVSHYGRLYNFFWFNDGYHAEHHQFPREHWSLLPGRRGAVALPDSAWPPHLRFFERSSSGELKGVLLCALERIALGSRLLQRFMLWSHARAIAPLLANLPERPHRVAIVGGGLFPRTLLLLSELLPDARFVVVDRSVESVSRAVEHLKQRGFPLERVRFCIQAFDPSAHCHNDLVVAPLGYVGDAGELGEAARRTALLRHDWLWTRPSGHTRVVSWLLLKRVTLSLAPS